MIRASRVRRLCAFGSALALVAACSGADDDTASSAAEEMILPRAELLKPETCGECHPKHYREWASSMHAYAANDPVFIAMNRRGQRDAQLGEFCVKCHAPMAVIEQPDTDWTKADIEKLPDQLKGVTCYFCHNAVEIGHDHDNAGDHNNMLRLANDTTLRANIGDPANPKVHHAAYSKLHDPDKAESSALCGGCHDIVTPAQVMIERTFAEYKTSIFATPDTNGAISSCGSCHMPGAEGTGVAANVKGVVRRKLHEHIWPAVDVARGDFPNRAAQRAAVECALGNSISVFKLKPDQSTQSTPGTFIVTLETNAGHNQPSGAAQDRRMWIEAVAYDDRGKVIYESGKVDDDAPEPVSSKAHPVEMFRDKIYDADAGETRMFWQAAPSKMYPDGFESRAIPVAKPVTGDQHTAQAIFVLPVPAPARMEFRVRMRPIGRDVLQDLVDSRDLDAAVLDEMPTFTLYSAVATWASTDNPDKLVLTRTDYPDCQQYLCLFDPNALGCEAD